MRTFFSTALLALLVLTAPTAQAGNSFASAGEVGQWIMEYYQHPQPKRLADALITLADSEGISEDGRKLVVSFIGSALAQAPKEHDDFFKAITKHKLSQLYALPAFWFMNNDAGRALLVKAEKQWTEAGLPELAQQLIATPSPALLEGPVKGALHLDHLWSYFFATGKPEPVLKITSAMSLLGNKNTSKHIIGQSAQWSLKANARVHPKVRQILEETLQGAQEPLKSQLAKTLQN